MMAGAAHSLLCWFAAYSLCVKAPDISRLYCVGPFAFGMHGVHLGIVWFMDTWEIVSEVLASSCRRQQPGLVRCPPLLPELLLQLWRKARDAALGWWDSVSVGGNVSIYILTRKYGFCCCIFTCCCS